MLYNISSMDQYLSQQWLMGTRFPYQLHSRFNHAINWMNNEGDMLTFLSKGLPNAPNTLLIDVENFIDWHLNDSVTLQQYPQGLFISSNITLNITSDTQRWLAELPQLSKVNTNVIRIIDQFLYSYNDELSGFEQKIYQQLDDNYAALSIALTAHDYDQVTEYARKNIGLGLGLTPSGDDRLVGFLLGCFIQQPIDIDLLEALQKAIEISQDRTNDISYAMLKHARKGRFNEWLVQLSHAIEHDSNDGLEQAISSVFSIGSRSGGDMLKGLVLSLER